MQVDQEANLVVDDVKRENANRVDVLLRAAGTESMVVAGGDPREGVAHRIRHHRHPLLLGRHLLKKKFKLKLKLKHSF